MSKLQVICFNAENFTFPTQNEAQRYNGQRTCQSFLAAKLTPEKISF